MAKLLGIARKIGAGCEYAQRPLARFSGLWAEVDAMATTVTIPDQMARRLRLKGPQGKRRVLEMLAAEGYRSGALSRDIVGELLGRHPDETVRFLKDRRCIGVISLDGYEDISDALTDFTSALLGRSRARKKPSQ